MLFISISIFTWQAFLIPSISSAFKTLISERLAMNSDLGIPLQFFFCQLLIFFPPVYCHDYLYQRNQVFEFLEALDV